MTSSSIELATSHDKVLRLSELRPSDLSELQSLKRLLFTSRALHVNMTHFGYHLTPERFRVSVSVRCIHVTCDPEHNLEMHIHYLLIMSKQLPGAPK
jgi:hypothetical protein